MIKAPFNFVPLNKEVYFPEWAKNDEVSQDVPFHDGLSGSLELIIQNETPIFIRDGHRSGDDSGIQEFCHTDDNRYYIPGTSIKGALRNVMEIVSFGKMTQIQNQSFGLRDLSNGADGHFYRKKVTVSNVHCGWLRLENGEFVLNDHGMPWRISAEKIDEIYDNGNRLSNFIRDGRNFKQDENRTAKKKYSFFRGLDLNGRFSDDEDFTNSRFNAGGRSIKCYDPDGNEGTIVLTGQSGARKEDGTGKLFEFIFPKVVVTPDIRISDSVRKAFETIHQNSPDYKDFRKPQLFKGESIPVFFILDNDGEVESMGLSYMFKYPAFNSVHNGIKPLSLLDKDKHDLCECIFGYTDKKGSLRGRVQFSPAFLQGEPSFYQAPPIVLSSPHPSYYPIYLGKGQTWNSEFVTIAGRKRYPVRSMDTLNENSTGSHDMIRNIIPLNPGSTFIGKIYFHNLKPIELGALISSVTFCNNEDCYHSLGQGKPFGYGKVKMSLKSASVKKNSDGTDFDFIQAAYAFEKEMSQSIENWKESDQLKELFAMAKGFSQSMNENFTYMHMDTDSKKNEFKTEKENNYNKGRGKQLGTFTEIISGNIPNCVAPSIVGADKQRADIEAEIQSVEFAKEIMERLNADDEVGIEEIKTSLTSLQHLVTLKADDLYTAIKNKKQEREKQERELRQEEEKRKREEEKNALMAVKEEKAKEGLEAFLKDVSSLRKLKEGIAEYKSFQNSESFSEDEIIVISSALKKIKDELKKKMGKKVEQLGWGSSNGQVWKDLTEIIGSNISNQVFEVFTKS